MRISVIAVGTRMPCWVSEGSEEYSKRMPSQLSVSFREIPLAKRGRDSNPEVAIARESEQIIAAIGKDDHVVALEVGGENWSTPQLARKLEAWQLRGGNLSLLIGGPDGLSDACRARAAEHWSLSPLTLPHPLVRIILAEQLYRAWTINSNHPYHR